jgi:fructose-bisphosphate aldolase, class I
MTSPAMESTIEALLVRGKGILAADESSPTIAKRFADIHLASTEESRMDKFVFPIATSVSAP